MSKRFIDYYLEAVTKKSGGGSDTVYPYKPASGYTGMPLADGRSMDLSQIKNRGTNTFWYGALPEIAPVVGDKMCFYGIADDDGTDAPFAVWGTISQYYAYNTYCYIKFSAYDGASYVEDGVQTVVGGGSFVSDGNDNLTVDAVATLYPIKPPASLGYKEMAVTQNLTLTNLKNYWDNKNTNAQYRTALDDTLASGDKVLLVGYATDSGKTWPFALWGTVNTTVKYTSYMYVKLATYDGLSIMKLDSTYDSIVGETHIYENGTYVADSGNSVEVNVSGGGTQPVLVNKTITANGTYNASSDNADGYDKVVVNVPNPSAGSMNITENGTYDVTDKASVVVDVQSGGSEDVITGSFKPTSTTDGSIDTGYTGGKSLKSIYVGVDDRSGGSPSGSNILYDYFGINRTVGYDVLVGYKDSTTTEKYTGRHSSANKIPSTTSSGQMPICVAYDETTQQIKYRGGTSSYVLYTGYTYNYILVFE